MGVKSYSTKQHFYTHSSNTWSSPHQSLAMTAMRYRLNRFYFNPIAFYYHSARFSPTQTRLPRPVQ